MKKYYIKTDFNQLMNDKLINLSVLADRTGLHLSTIFRLKRENTEEPRPSTLQAIADYLKMFVARDENGIYFFEKEDQVKEKELKYEVQNLEEQLLISYYKRLKPDSRMHIIAIIKTMAGE